MTISSYFWSAYSNTTEFVSSTAAAVAEKVNSITQEDVAAAARKVQAAAHVVMEKAANALNCLPPLPDAAPAREAEVHEGPDGEEPLAEGAEGWIEVEEPGAPGGPKPVKQNRDSSD